MQQPYNNYGTSSPYTRPGQAQQGGVYYPYYGQAPYGGPPAPQPSPAEKMRRMLRIHSVAVGLAIIAYHILQEIFFVMLSLVGLYDEYLNNAAFQNLFSAVVLSAVALGVPFLIAGLLCDNGRPIKEMPLAFPEGKLKTVCLIFAGLAVCMAANYAAVFVERAMNGVGLAEKEIEELSATNVFEGVVEILTSACIPAIVEEFVFRGVIMQPLRRYGDHFAIITSSILFGLAHGRITSAVFAFMVGLGIGYADVMADSLWVGIVIHCLNNVYAVTVTDIYANYPDLSDSPVLAFQAVVIVLGLAGAVYIAATRNHRVGGNVSGLSKGKRFRAFYLTIPMLIAFAVFAFYISLSIERA